MSGPRQRILIVCTGNICRSPIAEGFLRRAIEVRQLDDPPVVTSAGLFARTGTPVTEGSVVAARERGVDIADHRATQISSQAIVDADLIVTMTTDHRDEIAQLVPDAAARTFTLKELVRLLDVGPDAAEPTLTSRVREAADARGAAAPYPYPEDVADPLGQPLHAYRGVAWEIDDLVDRLDRGLFGARTDPQES